MQYLVVPVVYGATTRSKHNIILSLYYSFERSKLDIWKSEKKLLYSLLHTTCFIIIN